MLNKKTVKVIFPEADNESNEEFFSFYTPMVFLEN
jgi:hypothetical protein